MVLIWGQFLLRIKPMISIASIIIYQLVFWALLMRCCQLSSQKKYLSPDKQDILPGVSLPDLEVKAWLPKGNSRSASRLFICWPKVIHMLTHTYSYWCLAGNEGMTHNLIITINNHPIPPYPSIRLLSTSKYLVLSVAYPFGSGIAPSLEEWSLSEWRPYRNAPACGLVTKVTSREIVTPCVEEMAAIAFLIPAVSSRYAEENDCMLACQAFRKYDVPMSHGPILDTFPQNMFHLIWLLLCPKWWQHIEVLKWIQVPFTKFLPSHAFLPSTHFASSRNSPSCCCPATSIRSLTT